MKQAKARGAKVILVDARKSDMAHYADIHLQIFPGEDVTVAAGLLLFLTDLWNQQGYATTTGFLVGAVLATVNLWILAGGYFAMVDGRAVLPRLMLACIGSMVVMFGVALFVIVAKHEWTLGFSLGIALPALSGIVHGLTRSE